jgi:hypothetical protein
MCHLCEHCIYLGGGIGYCELNKCVAFENGEDTITNCKDYKEE